MKGSTNGSPPSVELPSDVKTLLAEFLKRSKTLRQESANSLKTAFDGESSLPALLQFVHDTSSALSDHENGIVRQRRAIYEYAAGSEDIAKTTTISDDFKGFTPPVALNHERNTLSMQSRIAKVQGRIANMRELLDSSSVEKAQEIQQKMSDLQNQLEALERFSDLARQVSALRSRIVTVSPVKKNTQRRSSGRVGLVIDSDDENDVVANIQQDDDNELTDLAKAVEVRASLNPFREQASRPTIMSSSSFNVLRQQSNNSLNKRAMLSRQPSSSSAAPSSRHLYLQHQQQAQRKQLGRKHWQRSAQALRSETRPCYSLPLYLHLEGEDQESDTLYVQARRRFCAVQALPWQTNQPHGTNPESNTPNKGSSGALQEDLGRLIDARTLTAAASAVSTSSSTSTIYDNSNNKNNKDANKIAESSQLTTLCASLETSLLNRIAYVYKVELPPPPSPVAPPAAPPSAPAPLTKSAETGGAERGGGGEVLRSPNRERSRSSLTEPPPLPLPQPSASNTSSNTSSNTPVSAPSAATSTSASSAASVPASIASQSALRPANTLSAAECVEEVRLIFATYNAERLAKLPKLLEKYVNKEHDLLRAVRDKYVPKDGVGASNNTATNNASGSTTATAFRAANPLKAAPGFGTPTPFGTPSSSTAGAKPTATTTATTTASGGLATGFGQGWGTSSSTASNTTPGTSLFGAGANKPAATATTASTAGTGGAFGLGFGAKAYTATNNNLTPIKSTSVFGAPAASSSASLSTPSTAPATTSAFGQGWGTPSNTSSSSATPSVAQIQARVTQIYQTHNPQKLSEIGGLFEKYRGRESELLQRIEAKYNVGSSAAGTPAAATAGGGFGAANASATSAFGLKGNTPSNNPASSAFGANAGGGFGGGFGAATGNTPFGATSTAASSGFGLGSGAKPAFGATPTPFGAPSSSSSSTLPLAPALSAPSSTPFGQTGAATGGAFNTSAFGAGFGASPAPATSLFSSPAAPAATTAPVFGSPSTLNTSLFGARPAAAGAQMTQPSPGFGAVATSLFRH